MRLPIVLLLLAGSFSFSSAPGQTYAVSAIPDTLLKGAKVVKRMEEIRFEVIGTDETVMKTKYALTILNENGDDAAAFVENYDKLRSVKEIEGALYDAAGNLLRRLKPKEVQDLSGMSDNNLVDDNRIKAHHFYHRVYPYTVEYEYEVRYNHSFFFPAWTPLERQGMSVQKSTYTLVYPPDYAVRYRGFNYKGEPVAGIEKEKKTLTWSVTELPTLQSDYAAPLWYELAPVVFMGPSAFEIEGYKGNMSSWQEFGKFIYHLKKERDQLPADVAAKVQSLINGVQDPRERVRILYEFLQKNTRYISIQLGIGGWQPFEASYVARKGYGDCKALTNYMYSLLKAAGITSYDALVKAGNTGQIVEDFPAQQFNHVILCVPLQKDTVWLECTSQSLPAGYVSDFTANRKALLIDEKGGVLVSTPRYGLSENLQLRSIRGKIDEEGTLNVRIHTSYRAMQQDDVHSMITSLSKEKVQKVLQEGMNLTTYEINGFAYEQEKGVMPQIHEQLDVSVRSYANITGKRLFLVPNLLNRSNTQLSTDKERVHPFRFTYAWHDRDTVEFELPPGYDPESLPQEVNLKTKWGNYFSSVRLVNNKLVYVRLREHFAGTFPASDAAEMAKYYTAIYKADRAKVVLVKDPSKRPTLPAAPKAF